MTNHRALSELCDFRCGGTPSKSNPAFWIGDIPWVSPKDMKPSVITDAADKISPVAIEQSAASTVPPESILVVVRSGVLAHTFPVARTLASVSFNQDIKALIPKSSAVEPEYLFWFVRSRARDVVARGVKKGATVHSVISGFLEQLRVPLLPLSEQRRIANVLSRAEGIVRLRLEAQAKTSELIPALFVKMFGNPGSNPKGWPVRRIDELVKRFEGGKNVQAGDEESKYRILKISAITSGSYIEAESKPAPNTLTPIESHFVRPGDLLISRANTEALVGATAIVERTDGRTLLPDKLWRIVWRDDVGIESRYALHLLQQRAVRTKLSQLASGTGGSMKNISQAKLKKLGLPVPPIELQRHFSTQADAIRGIVKQQDDAMAKAQAVFDALLHQSFVTD